MKFDLATAIGRAQLAAAIEADIDNYCATAYDDGPRKHLGASQLGHPCEWYLWAVYRWLHHDVTYTSYDGTDSTGRMRRLFKRGHWEEAHWFEWLRATGWTATDVDPTTGKQIRIRFAEGHGGGSLDAEASHPIYTGTELMLGEFKTYNEKQFNKLLKEGMPKAKPQHWVQKCVYGAARKIRYGFYCAICKNDDRIKVEVHVLNWQLGEDAMRKGTEVILSKVPPPKLSENPAWVDCKWCEKRGVCHENKPVDVNCRSCRHAQPYENGEWFCNFHNSIIPEDFIPKACEKHFPLVGPLPT
jgi:hypothetical protein